METETPNFSPKDTAMLAHLLRNTRRVGASGNYLVHFGDGIGKRLLRRIMGLGWTEQTGWYLSGRPCYRLSDKGRKDIRRLTRPLSENVR